MKNEYSKAIVDKSSYNKYWLVKNWLLNPYNYQHFVGDPDIIINLNCNRTALSKKIGDLPEGHRLIAEFCYERFQFYKSKMMLHKQRAYGKDIRKGRPGWQKSILDPYRDDMIDLFAVGNSVRGVRHILFMKGLDVSKRTVYNFKAKYSKAIEARLYKIAMSPRLSKKYFAGL